MTIRDKAGLQALTTQPNGFLAWLLKWLYQENPLLEEVYRHVGPELPKDLTEETIFAEDLPDHSVLLYNFDEGHAGRFTVSSVGDEGGSIAAKFVLSQPSFHDFIINNLAYPVCNARNDSELIFFSPGLNTIHQPFEQEMTSPSRCQMYTKVMQAVHLTQIHTGTSFDQPAVVVDGSTSPVLSTMLKIGHALMPNQGLLPTVDGDIFTWGSREIDTIQTALSSMNLIDTPLKQSIRELLHTLDDPSAHPVTLMVYSRATVETKGALQVYIEEREKAGIKKDKVEKVLRAKLTIVTIGSVTRGFPNGPKYIHCASRTDHLNGPMGVNERHQRGAGDKAVILNCNSPYNKNAADNHNFCSVTSQYLSILLKMNDTGSFAKLWELKQSKTLRIPDKLDEVICAMITLTKGTDWLWDATGAMQGVPDGKLPDEETAKIVVDGALGEEFSSQVIETFS